MLPFGFPRALRESAGHALPLSALLALSGCATPHVSVVGASVDESTPETTSVLVELEMKNPADDTMRLLTWDYTATFGGASYSGLWEALVALPPNNEPMRTKLPCVIPTSALDTTAAWRISGAITFRSPSRIARIPSDLGLYRPSTSFAGGGVGVTGAQAQ